MRVVIAGGLCVESDAISAAIINQAELLSEMPGIDTVDVVTHHCDRDTAVPVHIVLSSWEFLRSPVVAAADRLILHWGIHYPIFDALPVLPHPPESVIVHFHNVTPAHLMPPEERPNIERSLRQIQLLLTNPHPVWTESEFNAATLRSWGVPADQITIMPFPIEPPRKLRRQTTPGKIAFLTVGRLVPAKGVDVLLAAFADMLETVDDPTALSLTVVGNPALSDDEYMDRLLDIVVGRGLTEHVTFVHDADDDELWSLLESTDVVVSPSLHEGLCVPVVEAYRAGCRVVASDGGNLAYIVQPPDPVVAKGNVAALADALRWMVGELREGRTAPPPGAAVVADLFSTASTRRRLRDAIGLVRLGSREPVTAR